MLMEMDSSSGFAILTVMLASMFFGTVGVCIRNCLKYKYSNIDCKLCWGLLNIKNNNDDIPSDIETGSLETENNVDNNI